MQSCADYHQRPMRQGVKGLRVLAGLAVLVLLVAMGAAGAAWWWLQQPLTLARPSIELSIESGTTPRDIAQAWVDAGVQTDPLWLYAWFRASGQDRRIRAGSYEIHAGTTPRGLLEALVQGRETLQTVRLIEGWTLRQVRQALATAPQLKSTIADWDDQRLMKEVGSPGVPAEGRFFPDTYAYARGVSDLTVLRRAHRAMQQRLAEACGRPCRRHATEVARRSPGAGVDRREGNRHRRRSPADRRRLQQPVAHRHAACRPTPA